jgi:hypothetical protein
VPSHPSPSSSTTPSQSSSSHDYPPITPLVPFQRLDMHFSSSPGFLSSVDDFFVVNGRGNLAVMKVRLV